MIHAWKYVGETPLQCIHRIRGSYAQCGDTKISYAGRLDPMAHGVLPLLIGDEENKIYEQYLAAGKTYVASFLLGVATDSYDILGLHTKSISEAVISSNDCENIATKIQTISTQTYPWFSAKTVDGKKLFDHYRAGNTEIERPKRAVEIFDATCIRSEMVSTRDVYQSVFTKIKKLDGDFRQDAILQNWFDWEKLHKNKAWQCITFSFTVSSGTYIRAFTELIPVPAVLYSLERTAVHFKS